MHGTPPRRPPARSGATGPFIHVKIKRLHPDAILPTYGTEGAACFDLHAAEDKTGRYGRVIVGTGLAMEIPQGYGLFMKPRSGMAFKEGVHAYAGTIDSDYRGELKVLLLAEGGGGGTLQVKKGDRIAQAMVLPVPRMKFEEVDELSNTDRGTGGFGSTGK